MAPQPIRTRIILPFLALVLVASAIQVGVSIHLIRKVLAHRIQEQARTSGRILAGVPLHGPEILTQAAQVLDVELATLDGDGRVLHHSQNTDVPEDGWAGRPAEGSLGSWWYVRIPVESTGPGTSVRELCVLVPERRLRAAATGPATQLILLGLLVMAGTLTLGYLVARGITGPIETLAASAKRIGRGEASHLEQSGGGLEVEQLASELERMLERLAQTGRLAALGELALTVAHEIRNPLTAIRMSLQLAGDSTTEEERKRYEVLLGELARLEHVTSELLLSTRPRPAPCEPVDLSNEVEAILSLYAHQLNHRGVLARLDVAPNTPPARADTGGVRQILTNLLLNAVDALPEGGQVTFVLTPTEEGSVRLQVEDSGPGVPPEERDRIFEPFVTTRETGFGLGLAVSRQIAEGHGGSLELLPPEPGRGALFELRFEAFAEGDVPTG